jgi:hypothetical protein
MPTAHRTRWSRPVPSLRERSGDVEGIVSALVESAAILLSPRKRAHALELIASELKLADVAAEAALQDLSVRLVRKPYARIETLRGVQAIISKRIPAVRDVPLNSVIDDDIVIRLERSGFLGRVYSHYGIG